jgi:transcriptional regulator with XRE-family HTH domain
MGASDGHDSLTAPESLEQLVSGHGAIVTVNLLSVNTFAVAHFAPKRASFSGMSDTEVDSQKVARRLRAVMAHLELETVSDFAKFLHAERSQVSNWLQGYNLPPTRWMNKLCRIEPNLNFDWIYRGVADHLPMAFAIKLEALVQGLDVPLVDARASSEPEPPKESPVAAPSAGRISPKKDKGAT